MYITGGGVLQVQPSPPPCGARLPPRPVLRLRVARQRAGARRPASGVRQRDLRVPSKPAKCRLVRHRFCVFVDCERWVLFWLFCRVLWFVWLLWLYGGVVVVVFCCGEWQGLWPTVDVVNKTTTNKQANTHGFEPTNQPTNQLVKLLFRSLIHEQTN